MSQSLPTPFFSPAAGADGRGNNAATTVPASTSSPSPSSSGVAQHHASSTTRFTSLLDRLNSRQPVQGHDRWLHERYHGTDAKDVGMPYGVSYTQPRMEVPSWALLPKSEQPTVESLRKRLFPDHPRNKNDGKNNSPQDDDADGSDDSRLRQIIPAPVDWDQERRRDIDRMKREANALTDTALADIDARKSELSARRQFRVEQSDEFAKIKEHNDMVEFDQKHPNVRAMQSLSRRAISNIKTIKQYADDDGGPDHASHQQDRQQAELIEAENSDRQLEEEVAEQLQELSKRVSVARARGKCGEEEDRVSATPFRLADDSRLTTSAAILHDYLMKNSSSKNKNNNKNKDMMMTLDSVQDASDNKTSWPSDDEESSDNNNIDAEAAFLAGRLEDLLALLRKIDAADVLDDTERACLVEFAASGLGALVEDFHNLTFAQHVSSSSSPLTNAITTKKSTAGCKIGDSSVRERVRLLGVAVAAYDQLCEERETNVKVREQLAATQNALQQLMTTTTSAPPAAASTTSVEGRGKEGQSQQNAVAVDHGADDDAPPPPRQQEERRQAQRRHHDNDDTEDDEKHNSSERKNEPHPLYREPTHVSLRADASVSSLRRPLSPSPRVRYEQEQQAMMDAWNDDDDDDDDDDNEKGEEAEEEEEEQDEHQSHVPSTSAVEQDERVQPSSSSSSSASTEIEQQEEERATVSDAKEDTASAARPPPSCAAAAADDDLTALQQQPPLQQEEEQAAAIIAVDSARERQLLQQAAKIDAEVQVSMRRVHHHDDHDDDDDVSGVVSCPHFLSFDEDPDVDQRLHNLLEAIVTGTPLPAERSDRRSDDDDDVVGDNDDSKNQTDEEDELASLLEFERESEKLLYGQMAAAAEDVVGNGFSAGAGGSSSRTPPSRRVDGIGLAWPSARVAGTPVVSRPLLRSMRHHWKQQASADVDDNNSDRGGSSKRKKRRSRPSPTPSSEEEHHRQHQNRATAAAMEARDHHHHHHLDHDGENLLKNSGTDEGDAATVANTTSHLARSRFRFWQACRENPHNRSRSTSASRSPSSLPPNRDGGGAGGGGASAEQSPSPAPTAMMVPDALRFRFSMRSHTSDNSDSPQPALLTDSRNLVTKRGSNNNNNNNRSTKERGGDDHDDHDHAKKNQPQPSVLDQLTSHRPMSAAAKNALGSEVSLRNTRGTMRHKKHEKFLQDALARIQYEKSRL